MGRSIGKALAVAIVIAAALTGFVGRPAAAASDEEQAARQADQALLDAIGKKARKSAGRLLDAHFTWTDVNGKTRSKVESLRGFATLGMDPRDTEVESHFYGQVFTVTGVHQDARFARVWVKRKAGWRTFLYLETPNPKGAQASNIESAAGKGGDCVNPCKTVPYKPRTAMDKAILATWQKTKMEEWHPDADDWATHIADEFLIINNNSMRNKAERIVIAKKQQEAGIGTVGDPITSMRIYDFGKNSAVMVSHHTRAGKPYYNIRIWVLRDDRWQLALSQQTTIQAAPLPKS